MTKKVTALLALAAGLVIGGTWPRTKTYVHPLLNGARKGLGSACGWLVGFGTAQKRRLDGLVSKASTRKKTKGAATAAKRKPGRAKAAKATRRAGNAQRGS